MNATRRFRAIGHCDSVEQADTFAVKTRQADPVAPAMFVGDDPDGVVAVYVETDDPDGLAFPHPDVALRPTPRIVALTGRESRLVAYALGFLRSSLDGDLEIEVAQEVAPETQDSGEALPDVKQLIDFVAARFPC